MPTPTLTPAFAGAAAADASMPAAMAPSANLVILFMIVLPSNCGALDISAPDAIDHKTPIMNAIPGARSFPVHRGNCSGRKPVTQPNGINRQDAKTPKFPGGPHAFASWRFSLPALRAQSSARDSSRSCRTITLPNWQKKNASEGALSSRNRVNDYDVAPLTIVLTPRRFCAQ